MVTFHLGADEEWLEESLCNNWYLAIWKSKWRVVW